MGPITSAPKVKTVDGPVPMPLPPSPTLTNPEMILPYVCDDTSSPPPRQRISYMMQPAAMQNTEPATALASATAVFRHRNSSFSQPFGRNRDGYRTIDKTAAKFAGPKDLIASSPTVHGSSSYWAHNVERRRSDAQSSVGSDELNDLKWPRFDSSHEGEDAGSDLDAEEEERFGSFPQVAGSDDEEEEEEQWDNSHTDVTAEEDEEDPYSSAALSRRADIILANAKKRLNLMEGNLRGARTSLLITPSGSLPALRSTPLYSRERGTSSALSFTSAPRAYESSVLNHDSSPGHSRVSSEADVLSPIHATAPTQRNSSQIRSSSALAFSLAQAPVDRKFSMRESRSQESLRILKWNSANDKLQSSPSGSQGSSGALEPVPEDGSLGVGIPESPSTTTDLREQMNDLKGRISKLQQRAREDGMRRRSLQSLRTPSPFTSAPEVWYTGAEGFKATSPLSADAGVGWTSNSPVLASSQHHHPSDTNAGLQGKQELVHEHAHKESSLNSPSETASQYEDATEEQDNDVVNAQYPVRDPDSALPDDDEDDDAGYDTAEGESVYEDPIYEPSGPLPERHEDREDAFDYQNFFLHSAMGTYSHDRRRSSVSSTSSVETTKPINEYSKQVLEDEHAQDQSHLQRRRSAESISTLATFVTATDGELPDDPTQDDLASNDIEQPHGQTWSDHSTPFMNSSPTLGGVDRFSASLPPPPPPKDQPTSNPASPVTNGILPLASSALLEALGCHQFHDTDKALIGSLERSLRQVCEKLETAGQSPYESREWRRRLDLARRALDGDLESS